MKRIHLVHTNDLHSHLESMAKVDTYVNMQRKEWEKSGEAGLLLDVGDHLDRVRFETEGTDGLVNRAILNASGYNAVTLGNNELITFTRDELTQIFEDVSFRVVCCNVEDSLFRPYSLYKLNGIKLAVIGVTVQFEDLYQQLGWKVTNPVEALKNLIPKLRREGYLIILLSHLGYPSDVSLAKEVPGIDIIMGGHTHHLLETPQKIGQTTLAAAGKHGHYLGYLTLECEDTGELVSVTGEAFHLQAEPSQKITTLISEYSQLADKNLLESIVVEKEELLVKWDEETPFANLLADSLVAWTGAKFGLCNSGQLLHSLPKGTITKKAIHAVCPHPINPVVLAIKGKDLRLVLEESLLSSFQEQEIRGFGFRGKLLGNLAVSGMTIQYNPDSPKYEKIKAIYMGNKLLVDEQVYEVATVSMFVFGLGYSRMKQSKVIRYFLPDMLREVLTAGLQSSSLRRKSHLDRWTTVFSKEVHDGNVRGER